MENLCIVPCGKKKIWDIKPQTGAVYAKDAYQGTLHKKCQSFADKNNYPWVILSAKHGFLLPFDIVPENYDTGFHFPKREVISDSDLHSQWQTKKLNETKSIILLTGQKHEKVMHRIIKNPHHYTWVTPLKGCRGIGDMLHRLNEITTKH
ncbi:hypothetical protein D7Z54_15210 [Salibacterium salarium]|uniref:DUF6884 domain-containing protein n=1 Tax=Salibacterium salarium TaxID=284579 RepID=A0A3R9QK45_9BACI|nr:DUF6884 domain-containing protein [Salibacterium salarium]RSL32500.1 hypothetical protein D7Z54_15210 [Salibacterium salarium]